MPCQGSRTMDDETWDPVATGMRQMEDIIPTTLVNDRLGW